MEVLVCLAQHPGEPQSKESLLRAVWGETFVSDDALTRSIFELRRVFEDDAREPRFIQTIPKRGYRLIAPIEWVSASQDAPAMLPIKPANVRKLWTVGLAVTATALLLVLLAAFNLGGVRTWLAGGNRPQIHSIAVLPLRSLSSDPNQEYFSDGLTDGLITDLAQISSLKVISHTSTMQYKDSKKPLPEIARELNVDGIIEGTVQRSGDRIRITAQLIHGPSDKHVWANTYERDMRDVFALERDVTQDITNQIQARLSAPQQHPLAQPRAVDPKVLEAYLQGTYHLNKYGSGSGVEATGLAAKYFQQAIDADPNFVPAYIGMANAHDDLPLGSREDLDIQRKAAETALALDPNSSDAEAILARLKEVDFDWPGAEKQYRRALALNPNNAFAHNWFSMFLSKTGHLDEALRECQIAQELDPNDDYLVGLLYERGEYDRAIATSRLAIERHPDDGHLRYVLFEIYAKEGRYKESVEELEKTFTLFGLEESAAKIHHAVATFGYQGAMRQAVQEMERLQTERQFYFPVNVADIYATLGEKDRAFYWLEQAYMHRDMISSGEGVDYVKEDPMLESLRSDPRFKDLLRRVGLPQ